MTKLQFLLLFVLWDFIYPAEADNEDKQKCLNDIIDWCNKQDYINEHYEYATLDTTELIDGKIVIADCITDRRTGTICTEDGYPWYSCSADQTATYRGTKIRKNSITGADYKICDTVSYIKNHTDLLYGKIKPKEDKQRCINNIVDWCSKQNYINAGNSLVYTNETTSDRVTRKRTTVYLKCITDKSGTKCTKNSEPWYQCSTDHTAIYKGHTLTKNSPIGADDEMCYTAARVNKFDWQFDEIITTDKQKCINDIVDWCGDQNFKNVPFTEVTTNENINGKILNTYCNIQETGGILCLRNNYDWYTCTDSHKFNYKGVLLRKNSPDGADFEICYLAERLKKSGRPVGEARQKCVNDIVGWCNKQMYRNDGNPDYTTLREFNSQIENIQCITDKSGIRCTNNANSWFSCSADRTATYKGMILRENSLEGTDYDICDVYDYLL